MKTILNILKKILWVKIYVSSVLFLLFLISTSCQNDELVQGSLDMQDILNTAIAINPSADVYFGPQIFTIVSKAPFVETQTSLNAHADYFNSNFVITVQNGSSNKTKVTKIEIRIDGVLLVSSTDFRKNVNTVSKQISGLTANSELEVRLDGPIGGFIELLIEGIIVRGTVNDVESNSYKTIKIGNQWWMAENLRTTKYNDGVVIYEPPVEPAKVVDPWVIPYFGWYSDDIATRAIYGALYNSNAIDATRNGGKNLCPVGWHVPSDDEWHTLILYLDNTATLLDWPDFESTSAGNKLKEAGNTHWESPSLGTNESGFNALPGGVQYKIAYPINNLGLIGSWWTSTDYLSIEFPGESAWARILTNENGSITRYTLQKACVASVRCVKN